MVGFRSDKLRGHGSLGSVDEGFAAEGIDGQCEGVLDVLASLLGGHLVTSDDAGRVDLVLDEFVGSLKEFGSKNND